ncbi:putative membrane protein [Bosea sp. OAE506]
MLRTTILAGAALLALTALPITPAAALTMKECSAKYQDAKKANTLKGQKWNDFRKAQCADDDADENEAAAAVTEPAKPAATPASAPATPAAKPASTAKAKPAVFPKAVATKYNDLTAGKARLKTCADQYNANKTANANGELKWIEKGGGYWSQCNAKLKG